MRALLLGNVVESQNKTSNPWVLQIKKDATELSKAWGTSVVEDVIKKLEQKGERKMVVVQLFGDAKACETAQRMIEEAIENK